ncbi:twin-arginine translocase TatA/TatE family subunit [Povalibacter sp.]|uniref:twin-arginine translocase TatA/TatE family subunit n=1 Tax=Povalibacter sp. TaxID=1962978 RepID=UPI002F4222BC
MGIGFRELIIILLIALVLFGAKRLRNIGSDLGGAMRGFRQAVASDEDEADDARLAADAGKQAADARQKQKSA